MEKAIKRAIAGTTKGNQHIRKAGSIADSLLSKKIKKRLTVLDS